MQPVFHCEIEPVQSPHFIQIYEGLYKLQQRNLISVDVKPCLEENEKTLLRMKLSIAGSDKSYIVYYDTLDGLNWLDDVSLEDNLIFFRDSFKADYYFKRSYNAEVMKYCPENCQVYPLGLNYNVGWENDIYSPSSKINTIKKQIKRMILKRFYKGVLSSSDFEFPPMMNPETKILFLTRLWEEADDELNQTRVEYIRACQDEFGDLFTGGLKKDDFSMRCAKDLIAPGSLTHKTAFVKSIRSHNICIATTGLFDSISWKFAEYVSNSRAIISEPLNYQVPGEFGPGKNYYQFNNKHELIENITNMLDDKENIQEMMNRNYHYYNNYVKSENLVLNTLLTIYADINQ